MKKNILVFLSLFLLGGALHAQTPMALSNGSFEQWTSHSGYSVTVLFMPVSIYDTFSTPTSWDYPSYPVNQTVTFMGMNVNINTSIPLVKASRESGAVPAGNRAVKLQTFMLDDIVNPTVLSMAGSSIDTSITNQVIPSILSTGVVDIEAFIPLVSSLMSGSGDLVSMLPTLIAEDVNDYITGGIALGNFRPGRLTGSYKYHSAVSGDNGGVLLLGTHYNNTTHKRDIVGGGLNIGLVDATTYTPFEVEYFPLGDLAPGSANIDPDSLVVILISSASENRQQGSYLCLDNLMLWSAPDTCAAITTFSALPSIHEAQLTWSVNDPADSYELEYGPVGFALGSGTTATTTASTTSLTLNGLLASTTYDVYLRTHCSDTTYGDWSTLQFTTLPDTCASIRAFSAVPHIHEAILSWSTSSPVSSFELEYGPAGFTPGSGTTATTTATSLTLTGLQASTSYDIHLRTLCSNNIHGDWSTLQFTTYGDTCTSVLNLTLENQAGYDAFPEIILVWNGSSQPAHWEVEYGPQGFLHGTGTLVETNETSFAIFELENAGSLSPNTWYDFYVRSSCGESLYGDWDSVHYLSHCATVSNAVVNGDNYSATADNRISGYSISWFDTTGTERWGVYYGIYNSQLPDNWGTYVEVDTPYFEFPPLMPQITYSIEISANCGPDNFGDIVWVNFSTPVLEGIDNPSPISHSPITVSPNPANGHCIVSFDTQHPTLSTLQLYSIDGRLIQTVTTDGSPLVLDLPWQGMFLLQATTTTGVSTCKIINQ